MISRDSHSDNLFKIPLLVMMTWPLTLHIFETVIKLNNTSTRIIKIEWSKFFVLQLSPVLLKAVGVELW